MCIEKMYLNVYGFDGHRRKLPRTMCRTNGNEINTPRTTTAVDGCLQWRSQDYAMGEGGV